MGGHRLNNIQGEKGICNINKGLSSWLYHLCIRPIFIHQSLYYCTIVIAPIPGPPKMAPMEYSLRSNTSSNVFRRCDNLCSPTLILCEHWWHFLIPLMLLDIPEEQI